MDGDGAVVGGGGLLGDGQSEAAAWDGSCGVEAVKALEDAFPLVFGDGRALV